MDNDEKFKELVAKINAYADHFMEHGYTKDTPDLQRGSKTAWDEIYALGMSEKADRYFRDLALENIETALRRMKETKR